MRTLLDRYWACRKWGVNAGLEDFVQRHRTFLLKERLILQCNLWDSLFLFYYAFFFLNRAALTYPPQRLIVQKIRYLNECISCSISGGIWKINRMFDLRVREILGLHSGPWRPAEIPPNQKKIVLGEKVEIAAELKIQPTFIEQQSSTDSKPSSWNVGPQQWKHLWQNGWHYLLIRFTLFTSLYILSFIHYLIWPSFISRTGCGAWCWWRYLM